MSKQYMTAKEKAMAIRKELKKQLGVTSRQVSVRSRNSGYDEAIDIEIKDLTVNKMKVEEIASRYEYIRRCEYSGEILAGGNTYVFVTLDYVALSEAKEELLEVAKKIIDDNKDLLGKNEGKTIAENGELEIIYSPLNGHNAELGLYRREEVNEEGIGTFWVLHNIERRAAYNEHVLAEALAIFKYQYNFNIM